MRGRAGVRLSVYPAQEQELHAATREAAHSRQYHPNLESSRQQGHHVEGERKG